MLQTPLEANASETTHVMLQGQGAPALEQLVKEVGGEITHRLHLINAVGALLTKEQLALALKSSLVSRHVADLALDAGEDEPAAASCLVGGEMEITQQDEQITWGLHNKSDLPASVQSLRLSWPESLGDTPNLSLNGEPLALVTVAPAKRGHLEVKFPGEGQPQLMAHSRTELELQFQPGAVMTGLRQRDLGITLDFGQDCSAELVPGYANNDENTYFPAAVDASQLQQHGVTGKGVTVAIVDSGLWAHSALINNSDGKMRVLANYDAIAGAEVDEVFDESGHGTHMASILANSEPVTLNGVPNGSFKGIAPDVNLVAIKAFNVEGQGELLDIVRGIQYAVDNRLKFNIRVLNLSFAARPRWHYWEDPINQAVMHAWAAGLVVVAAAGNEGPEPMSIGSPGNSPYVITVGAVTDSWTPGDRSDDYIPDFSSRGPTPEAHIKPDLLAPGGHMTGITRPGSTLLQENPEYQLPTGEFVLTGTSQAAAVVSGVSALLLQLQPDLSPDDIKCRLTSSAELAINGNGLLAYSPFQQGHGYVSASRAITLGRNGCGNEGLDLQADLEDGQHFEGPAIVGKEGTPTLPGLERMVDQRAAAKGSSDTRRWGAKDHVERSGYRWDAHKSKPGFPFDWEELYLEEKERIETLQQGD